MQTILGFQAISLTSEAETHLALEQVAARHMFDFVDIVGQSSFLRPAVRSVPWSYPQVWFEDAVSDAAGVASTGQKLPRRWKLLWRLCYESTCGLRLLLRQVGLSSKSRNRWKARIVCISYENFSPWQKQPQIVPSGQRVLGFIGRIGVKVEAEQQESCVGLHTMKRFSFVRKAVGVGVQAFSTRRPRSSMRQVYEPSFLVEAAPEDMSMRFRPRIK